MILNFAFCIFNMFKISWLKFKNIKGSALLLAILVMAGVTAAGIGMSSLVISEIRQARNLDNAVVAYYAAESGIEDGLYQLRKVGVDVTDLADQQTLDNQATWRRSAEKKEERLVTGIELNQSVQFDIFNPQETITGKQITNVQINWTGDGSEWLEVSWLSWMTEGGWVGFPNKKLLSHALAGSIVNLVVAGVNENSDLYRLRLKALQSDIRDLDVTAYDEDSNLVEIPTIVVLAASGEFGSSQQNLKINIPLHSPVIGLFDYVLFSEESIIK